MTTIPFDAFWAWLIQHPNCLIRAGSPEAVLYDDDDLHWYLGPDGQVLVAQVIRGKRLMGELLIQPDRIAYVQDMGEERKGEHVFDLISENETERIAAYTFVLTHRFDEEPDASHGPAVH